MSIAGTTTPWRRCRAWIPVLAALGSVLVGGHPASADQNVVYDGAGSATHISLVGDSTLAGVRWYADYGPLERFNFVLSAESCRRTIELSCISREGYRSENVVAAMRTLDGQLGEVAVIMSGYNDPIWTIDDAIAGVVEEARSQGVEHVVWLTLRAGDDVDYSDPQEQSDIATFREYNEQLVEAAASSDGFLQVADWATYSLGASAWFEIDGVHLTPSGVDAVTTFITAMVERVLAGENVSPAEAPWTVLVPGAEGDTVAAVQQAVIDAGVEVPGGADGVYGYDTMAAVAEYQRSDGELQVTGAVDIATARALGIFTDSDDAAIVEIEAAVDATPPTVVAATEQLEQVAAEQKTTDNSTSPWLIAGIAGAALVGAVAARRRYAVAVGKAR